MTEETLSGGAIAGIVIGSIVGFILLFVLLLYVLRLWMRGPTKGSDNKKRLDGKTVAITGCNTGIGKVTAKDLARRGAKILMLCRDLDKAEATAKEIREETGATVVVERLDLASLRSVRECAQKLLDKEDKIDLLINNAGVMMCPNWKTEDGFDMQFGTNHLGHFLLTELLKPLLMKSSASGAHPRVVIVSSLAHESGRMNWDDLNWDKSYNSVYAYCQSKLANVLHCKELANRLEGTGITVYSLHPGVIATELSRHIALYKCLGPLIEFVIKTPFYGAQTSLYCALEDSIECETGMYYSDCKKKNPAARAQDKEDQKRLWEISETLVGIKSSS